MDLAYPEDHTLCINYQGGQRPLVEIISMTADEEFSIEASANKLMFVLSGSVRYSVTGSAPAVISRGTFTLVPDGALVTCCAKRNSRLMIVRFDTPVRFCECYCMEALREGGGRRQRVCRMEIRAPLWDFITFLTARIGEGLKCREFYEIKIRELFYLLGAYYSHSELYSVFRDCLSSDWQFAGIVRRTYARYTTARELAAAMNYTSKGFEKKFKKVFGQPPYQWIKKQKMDRLHHELTAGGKNLKTIAMEYGFAGPSQLSDFCRRNFNMPPGQLRKKGAFNKGKGSRLVKW